MMNRVIISSKILDEVTTLITPEIEGATISAAGNSKLTLKPSKLQAAKVFREGKFRLYGDFLLKAVSFGMLFNIHKVYTVYDYGSKGQSILEFTKDKPQRVDITAGRRNELLGVVEGSTVEYTPEPIELIDSNGGFRFSADIDAPTAIYIYLEKGYLLDHIQTTPGSVDQDLLLEKFGPSGRLIYCFFTGGSTHLIIRGEKKKDDSIQGKLLKSPRDLKLRRVLLKQCQLDYNSESLKGKEIFNYDEAVRYVSMNKKTFQNQISLGLIPRPKKIGTHKIFLKEDLDKIARNSCDFM